jgi:tetratricopeptide (TPR) repeat protein
MQRILLALIVLAAFWFQGVSPIVADYYKGKKEIAKALQWSPDDSMLHFKSGNVIRAIETNNGDLTQYSLWFNLGLRLAKQGAKDSAMDAFRKALYYYPNYDPAKRLMKALEEKK